MGHNVRVAAAAAAAAACRDQGGRVMKGQEAADK